jgi:colicin import membrane protein
VATWKLRFNPYLENWAPQAAWVKIPYTFALTESAVRIGNENATRLPRPSGVKMTMSDTRTIGEKIRSNTMYKVPGDLTSNNPVEYSVSLDSRGFVTAIDLIKSSGLPDFDVAVRRAIERSAPYPADANGVIPPKFILSHRPREVNSSH